MTERPASLTRPPAGYADWLAELKTGIRGHMNVARSMSVDCTIFSLGDNDLG